MKTKIECFLRFGRDIRPEGLTLPGKINMLVRKNSIWNRSDVCMILDCSKYVGPCRCGREHTLETKKVVVEYNALDKFDQTWTRSA